MPKISILVSSLGQGGAERVMAKLAILMSDIKNIETEFVVATPIISNDDRCRLASRVRLVELAAPHYMSVLKPLYEALKSKKIFRLPLLVITTLFNLPQKSLFPIVRYIKLSHPDIIFTAHYNSIVILANWLAGSPSKIVITEHTVLSKHFPSQIWFIRTFFPAICRFFYPKADKIVAVSKFVANDLIRYLMLPPEKVTYIYNPIIGESLAAMIAETCRHPWFDTDVPVFVSAGRMSGEKDYKTLLDAFAIFRGTKRARLLMLGDGILLAELKEYAKQINIDKDVDWLGFVENPIPYIKEADVFLLSSRYEGLPTVVIEALFASATIVATDCPGGIREILNDGEYGYIVPVASPQAMADAIKTAVLKPFPETLLQQRAEIFSEKASLQAYLKIIDDIIDSEIRG
jgi:glycosyltransferase involved in cell wall biosynthesis